MKRVMCTSFQVCVCLICISLAQSSPSSTPPKPVLRDSPTAQVRTPFSFDYIKAEGLAALEKQITTILSASSWTDGDKCSAAIQRYLKDYKVDSKTLKVKDLTSKWAEAVASNPLRVYNMIRRMLTLLQGEVIKVCDEEVLTATIHKAGLWSVVDLPNQEDLTDAILQILGIHYVYGYKANELRLGILGNIPTGIKLTFDDCLALGKTALEMSAAVLSYQWIAAAEEILSEKKNLGESSRRELNSAWKALMEATSAATLPILKMAIQHDRQSSFPKIPVIPPYQIYAGCRGETTRISEDERRRLKCHLTSGGDVYRLLHPLKTELLKEEPVVWRIHDFISSATCDKLNPTVSPRNLEDEVEIYDPDLRSESPKLMPWQARKYREAKERLNGTIEVFVNAVGKKGKETKTKVLQMVSYSSLGESYGFHVDGLNQDASKGMGKDGDRIATFLLFLSDVTLGGNIAFPMVGLYVSPVKGSAVLWFSNYDNKTQDTRTTRGACPVVLGPQLVANSWILYNEEQFSFRRTESSRKG